MSDDADKTQDRLEKEELIRKKYQQTIRYADSTGYCLNCGEALPDKRRWCDKDCADDWEHLNNRRNT
mgnify:FL=1